MKFMNSLTYIILLPTLLLTIIVEITASNRMDDNDYKTYLVNNPRQPPTRLDSTIGNIKRGYYYIENGFIIPVSRNDALTAAATNPPTGKRRQDSFGNAVEASNLPKGVKFTPLVRYRETKTKRKKLFVPNFFG